jgi:hypothetical protein
MLEVEKASYWNQQWKYIKQLLDEDYDIQDLINAEYFKSHLERPKQAEYEIVKKCNCCGSLVEDNQAKNQYKEDFQTYQREGERLDILFKKALLYYWNLDPVNEKAQKAFDIAWSQGHSYGHYEVCTYFAELVELIK